MGDLKFIFSAYRENSGQGPGASQSRRSRSK